MRNIFIGVHWQLTVTLILSSILSILDKRNMDNKTYMQSSVINIFIGTWTLYAFISKKESQQKHPSCKKVVAKT